jgi:L-lactate dehydrogenase complex protein LldG
MNARQDILNAIRACRLELTELPSLDQSWIVYDDPQKQFAETLTAVGGHCVFAATAEEINHRLAEIVPWQTAKKRLVLAPGVAGGNLDLAAIDDPHQLQGLDFVILPGEFAVAENAAIWITDAELKHRVAPFLTQHLALVVRAGDILHNLHQAYLRISFSTPQFGVFISGPSKTADIEQSLVIGAHGPRSLTVFVVAAP